MVQAGGWGRGERDVGWVGEWERMEEGDGRREKGDKRREEEGVGTRTRREWQPGRVQVGSVLTQDEGRRDRGRTEVSDRGQTSARAIKDRRRMRERSASAVQALVQSRS
ncbi:uncharacterized protein SCHCODRAFT_02331944 [Schizophyllum commune H4-8]|uniref:uncharacterized protein n=1 Tax=Schizophyllum commune (strain H4-8 / FGSC 9210) TaxID=578458 RepID=UPI00215ED40C|nr:uncharacterized protein SCHCODRAFT_02331944 [Schizophyllum commune H4-8]KAI5889889.1 hypothetical protein SCHCODRAFT_02331944 [Schizophyllum commune H4-8]